MTRNGKIARLPQGIREELNRRLQDGKVGSGLLRWLNEQPECQETLDEEFESRPITKQNLSEWRQGGYEDWVRKEEARLQVQRLVEKAGDLEREAGGMAIADRLGTLLAAELAVEMERLESIEDPKERWARLKDIARELSRLRREDHHERKLRMAEEEYERREKEAEKKKLLKLEEAMRNKPMTVSLNGQGDEAWKWTDWMIRVNYGLPMPHWWTDPQTAEEWSKLMMPYWQEEAGTSPKSKVQSPKSRSREESKPVRPGQSKSDQKSGPVAPGPSGSKSGIEETTKGNGAGVQEGAPCSAQPKAPSSLRCAGAVQRTSGPVSEEIEGAGTIGEIAKSGAESPSGFEPPSTAFGQSPKSESHRRDARATKANEDERGASDQ